MLINSRVSALDVPVLVPLVSDELVDSFLLIDLPVLPPSVLDLFSLVPNAFDSDLLSPQLVEVLSLYELPLLL